MNESIRKIIIHSSNWVGDTVMSLPAIKQVRKAYTRAHITILIKENIAPLFQGRDLADEVLHLPSGKGMAKLKAEMGLRKRIKQNGYDLAILFPNSFGSALRLFGCGIKKRIGYANEGRGILLTKTVKRTPQILSQHMTEYYMNILNLIGIKADDTTIDLKLPPEAEQFADDFLSKNRKRPEAKLFAFGIGSANNPNKMWSPKHYKRLAMKLSESYDAEVVLICSPDEYSIAEEISKGLYHKPIIPHGNLIENSAVISRCDGFVGNDSGAMHLSSALGIPTIGLFFATSPQNNFPLGENAHYIEKQIPSSYIKKKLTKKEADILSRLISPEEVIKKMKKIGLLPKKNSDY